MIDLILILALLAFRLAPGPAAATDIGPLAFACQDGTRFNLTFHDGGWATLRIGAQPSVLTQTPTASGILYEGHAFAYREHQGVSTLVRLPGGSETTCRKDG